MNPHPPNPHPFQIWVRRAADRVWQRMMNTHPAAWLVGAGVVIFGVLFGRLGVQSHRNFGTWSYDMGIYDQGLWLVSRGGDTFMSVRGLDFWGHHVNLIAFAFVPFYWLGAGPAFLYVVQAWALALGAVPTYLIARDKLSNAWMGLVFASVYLMYAPLQWISWAMFHPEALVITPFLFAWWFATKQRWGWFFAMVLLALSAREDVALAVVMMGLVLVVYLRRADDIRRVRIMCAGTVVLGLGWYVVATKVFIPYFNDGQEPFYITYFYGSYGTSTFEVASTIVTKPHWVVRDAIKPDRMQFYRDLVVPWGGLPVAGPVALLMALPQMMASVIGASPYARVIKYQYTSVMIAPIVIASVQGAFVIWRLRVARMILPLWMVACSVVTNVMWAPSPIGRPENFAVWSQPHPRHESLRTALSFVPDDASVSATYSLLPHLAHRREVYDWPNPFVAYVWGNGNCDRLPAPTTVEYVALDISSIGPSNQQLFDEMFAEGGPFEPVYEDLNVIVGKRVGASRQVDVLPQQGSCPVPVAGRSSG